MCYTAVIKLDIFLNPYIGSAEKVFPGGRVWGVGRVDSFKLSTADFESINLTEDSQFYLSLTKTVSHNN